MKLISAYVENFGKISKTEYNFNDNLNSFCHENGYGKTTLASFIKAMLYGLPLVKERGKFNDREHYYPFDGGKFGGNLTFENNGKVYKIVRFFDKKSEKKDEVTLYENNSVISLDAESLGKWLFDVNSDTFERTLYFDEVTSLNGNSSDITFKLTGIVENTDEESFKLAIKKLEVSQKELKKTGNKGLISETKQQILQVKEELQNLYNIDSALECKYEERNKLLTEIEGYEQELKNVSNLKIKQDNFNTYERYQNDASTIKKEIDEIKKSYFKGIPTESEIAELNKLVDDIQNLKQEKQYAKISEDIFNEFNCLRNTFKNGEPSNEDIEMVKKDVSLISEQSSNKTKSNNYVALIIIGVIEMLIGLICAFWYTPLSSFMGLGVIFIILGLKFKNDCKKIKESENNKALIIEKINNYLKSFNIYSDNYLDALYQLKAKLDRFNYLKKEIAFKENNLKNIDSSILESIEIIKRIFNKYDIILFNINEVKNQVKTIENDSIALKTKQKLYENTILKAESYKAEKQLNDRPIIDESYEEIESKVKNLRALLNQVDRDIKNDEYLIEGLNDKKNSLQELEEKKERYESRYKYITLALNYLLNAEENLKNKYVNPIKDKFLIYAEKLEKALGERVIMDKNFEVYFEKSGENKSRQYLSAGQNVLCDLCLRLALVDNMYRENNPFIILDDPFISLDENHIEKAKNLLKELSKERQIIYFTCHESRNI